MNQFLQGFEEENELDLVLKAAIAHLWFVTLHPFDDGNVRIARATAELMLARSDYRVKRFWSLSAQIRLERKLYYEQLERTQKGDLDITDGILWFLQCLIHALSATEGILSKSLHKAEFWQYHSSPYLRDRQLKVIHKLLDGNEGNLTSSK